MNFHKHKPASAAGEEPVDEAPRIRPLRDVPREMPVPPPPLPGGFAYTPPPPSEFEDGQPVDQTADFGFLDAAIVLCIGACCLAAIFSFLTAASGEAPEAWIVFGASLLLWVLLGIYGALRQIVKNLRALRKDFSRFGPADPAEDHSCSPPLR